MGANILLDAARMNEAMDEAKKLNPEFDSLYLAREDDLLQTVAPYLFSFPGNPGFETFFYDQGWGGNWGLIVHASVSRKELHRHFRRFLIVKRENGEEWYFRFYDPRVLRLFLPTCSPQQALEFFGPVDFFFMEDEDPAYALRFWLERGHLKSRREPFQKPSLQPTPAETKPEIVVRSEELVPPPKPAAASPQKPAKPRWNMFD